MCRCANCNKSRFESPGGLLLCRSCINVHYCSKVCQKDHWEAHVPKCFGEWTPHIPNPPYSSFLLPGLIPSDFHGPHDRPLPTNSPYDLPNLPDRRGSYEQRCLYLFLIRLRTTDWSMSIRAFNQLFPESPDTATRSVEPVENVFSFWTRQTLYPTDPTAMSNKAQQFRDLGEPFHGLGRHYGQSFSLDAVLKLLQTILEEGGINLGHDAADP